MFSVRRSLTENIKKFAKLKKRGFPRKEDRFLAKKKIVVYERNIDILLFKLN